MWAAIAAAFTGVQRSHPTFATAPVRLDRPASAAAGLSATALASVPPNQAARPTSCSALETVFVAMRCTPWEVGCVLRTYPSSGVANGGRDRGGRSVDWAAARGSAPLPTPADTRGPPTERTSAWRRRTT